MCQIQAWIQKGWNRYLALWRDLTGWKLFLFYTAHYTLLFMILSHFVFSNFQKAGKAFIWTTDGMPNYLPRLIYLSQTIRDGIQSLLSGEGWTFPLYDFRSGPMKTSLGGEPLRLLAVFWPWDKMDVLYDVLVLVRYYLTGLSFSIFGFYFKQASLPILIGAASYTFCGFSLYAGVRHPHFMAPMIFLPLLIIGTEKILKKERPFLLMAIVFLAMFSDLYFACMLAIMVFLYALVRFFALYEKDRGREFVNMLGRLVLSGGTGIALSGIIWIPVLLQMFGTGRIGRDVSIYFNLLKYNDSFYQGFLSHFIVTSGSIGSWTCLGFSVLAIPAVILLFVRRERNQRTLRILFLIMTVMLLLPAMAYVMSGFNALSNRWCFAYAFCVCTILMFQVRHFAEWGKRELIFTAIGTIIYFLLCHFVVDYQKNNATPVVLLIVAMILLALFWALGLQGKKSILPLCLIITCLSVCYSAYRLYNADQGNYVAEFTTKGSAYQYYELPKNSQYSAFQQSGIEDDSFYRVAGNNIARKIINMAPYFDINGLTGYSSLKYSDYVNWINELELPRAGGTLLLYGLSSRSPMLSLANVKYYVSRQTGKEVVPYGFQRIKDVQDNGKTDVILENQYALPVGYTYENYLERKEYDKLSALEKQEAQLQAVVLSDTPNLSGITESSVSVMAQQIPVTVSDSKGLTWKDGTLKVKQEKATITLKFEGLSQTETYLRIVNLDLTSGASTRHWSLSASTGETSASAYFAAEAYTYAHGVKTQLLDLGYTEDGYTTCTITFPSKGTFKLEDLEIWCQPMENYGGEINALREEALENVETNWRGLTGTISVSRDKMLCIAIPYDKGWTAYVDGEKVKLYQANTAFMAVELPAGDHEIELKYWMPGLTAGIVLSAFGVIGLGAVIIYWKRKKS